MCKEGDVVPNNSHFDTTRANVEFRGALALDLPSRELADMDSDYPFKGDMDVDGAARGVRRVRRRPHPARHAHRHQQLGRRPAGLDGQRAAVAEVCREYDTPLYLDACRITENAYLIKMREPGYAEKPCARSCARCATWREGCTMSAKKDAIVNMGGFLATRDAALANEQKVLLILTEGFPTYGGLSGRDLEALAIGMQEAVDEDYLHYRIASTHYVGQHLRDVGVPLIWPTGGHAIYLDAKRFATHLAPTQLPGRRRRQRDVRASGGVRACEIGTLMFGHERPRDGRGVRRAARARAPGHPAPHLHAVSHGLRHRGRHEGVRGARVAAALPHRRAGAVPAALLGEAGAAWSKGSASRIAGQLSGRLIRGFAAKGVVELHGMETTMRLGLSQRRMIPLAEAAISPLDIGLLRGYAVFDLLRTVDGRPFLLDEHLDRLRFSAATLGLEVPATDPEIAADHRGAARAQRARRGDGAARAHGGRLARRHGFDPATPTFLILTHELHELPDDVYESGAGLRTHRAHAELPEAKTTRLPHDAAQRDTTVESGALDLLYHDGQCVSEAASASVYFVRDGRSSHPRRASVGARSAAHVLRLVEPNYEIVLRRHRAARRVRGRRVLPDVDHPEGVVPIVCDLTGRPSAMEQWDRSHANSWSAGDGARAGLRRPRGAAPAGAWRVRRPPGVRARYRARVLGRQLDVDHRAAPIAVEDPHAAVVGEHHVAHDTASPRPVPGVSSSRPSARTARTRRSRSSRGSPARGRRLRARPSRPRNGCSSQVTTTSMRVAGGEYFSRVADDVGQYPRERLAVAEDGEPVGVVEADGDVPARGRALVGRRLGHELAKRHRLDEPAPFPRASVRRVRRRTARRRAPRRGRCPRARRRFR